MLELTTMSDLGAAVRKVRLGCHLTQGQLAERIGVTQGWVSRLENGAARAHAQLVLDAFTAMGAPLMVQLPDEVSDPSSAMSSRPDAVGHAAGARVDDPFADVNERLGRF